MKYTSDLVGRLRVEDSISIDLRPYNLVHEEMGKFTHWDYSVFDDDDCGMREFDRVYFESDSEYERKSYTSSLSKEWRDKIYDILKEEFLKRDWIKVEGDKVIQPVFGNHNRNGFNFKEFSR